MNRADTVAKIKAARAEARIKANAYMNIAGKRYDYWRSLATAMTYDEALTMFMRGTEHDIPGMANYALANFEWARDSEASEVNLAVADGRRDAFATIAEWMTTEESDR